MLNELDYDKSMTVYIFVDRGGGKSRAMIDNNTVYVEPF